VPVEGIFRFFGGFLLGDVFLDGFLFFGLQIDDGRRGGIGGYLFVRIFPNISQ
jgi:hypothetical protein